ncbi:hypothetical protein PTNB73_01109 [Pyrenophora teres f. teres]|nr:hypothetical protein PTNB85_00299 [Pyrenophora teres f. teres]KAE8874477.1 hypothetical protein PTNB73_01109 [Pyrenophora teres f. teres]
MGVFPILAIALPSSYANAPPAPDSPTKLNQPLDIHPNMRRSLSWDLVSSEEAASPGLTRSSAQTSRCASPPTEDEEFVECMTREVVYSREDEPLDVSRPTLSFPSSSKSSSPSISPPPSPALPFDTSAFPPHAHLFPSSPNGTWRNEAAHSLRNPRTIDSADLCEKVFALVEDATDGVTEKLNSICEGTDLPAIHDRAMGYLPKMKVPDRRKLEKVVERGWEAGVEVWKGMGAGEGMCEWVDMGGEWDVSVMMKTK